MLRRVARLALELDKHTTLPPDSLYRYVIPFTRLPKFDNTKIINAYTESIKISDVHPDMRNKVCEHLIDIKTLNTAPVKIDIRDGKLVSTSDHVKYLGKTICSVALPFILMHHFPSTIFSEYGVITMIGIGIDWGKTFIDGGKLADTDAKIDHNVHQINAAIEIGNYRKQHE